MGLETGKAIAVLGHDGAMSTAPFSHDGSRAVTLSASDGSARLWSIEPVSGLADRLRHPDHVWSLVMVTAPRALAPDGGGLLLATASFDGGVRIWRHARAANGARSRARRCIPASGRQSRTGALVWFETTSMQAGDVTSKLCGHRGIDCAGSTLPRAKVPHIGNRAVLA